MRPSKLPRTEHSAISTKTLASQSQASPSNYESLSRINRSRLLSTILDDPGTNKLESSSSEESITTIRERSSSQFISKSSYHFLQLYWRYVFGVVWPILLALIFIGGNNVKIRCLYVEMVMWGFWTMHVFPEGITALIPIFALPLLMIQHSYTTCTIYFQYGFLSLNTMLFAICVGYSGVHERLLLSLMCKLGGSPRVIHFILSLFSGIISIRMANAYALHLILPTIRKILQEIDTRKLEESKVSIRFSQLHIGRRNLGKTPVNLSMAFLCSVVYATTIGGLNFTSGTITNFVFKSSFQRRFPICNIPQTAWYCYTMPISIVSFLVSILWVQILHLGLWRSNRQALSEYHVLKTTFQEQKIVETLYYRLGTITLGEICVGVGFLIYLSLWYFDTVLYFISDAKTIYLTKFISDSTPFFVLTFILMLVPTNLSFLNLAHPNPARRPKKRAPGIISWEILLQHIPWSRILVLGASVAMAQAQFSSGLAKDAASKFAFMKNLNYWLLLFIVTLFANIITETCTNGIICGVFTPLIVEFSILANIHPVYLGLPFTLTCSLGFLHEWSSITIQKVAAVVKLPKFDFFITGIFPKLYIWMLIYATFHFYGKLIFNKDSVEPKDFLATNISCYCPPCPFNLTLIKNNW